jgi:hypothetical protein
MIVVELMGGLGNQLFQYALGRRLALHHQTDLLLDTRFLENRAVRAAHLTYRNYELPVFFSINPVIAPDGVGQQYGRRATPGGRLLHRLTRQWPGADLRHLTETTPYRFDPRAAHAPENTYLSGHWQHPAYAQPIEAALRAELRFRHPLPPAAQAVADRIEATESVCVHVRRGDFLTNPTHRVVGPDYYGLAETVLRPHLRNPAYFVFSDEPDWCRANLRFDGPTTFVTNADTDGRSDATLNLMSRCHQYIIPNSTYAWWAVWLNDSPGKRVVAPSRWVNDGQPTHELIDPQWITVSV